MFTMKQHIAILHGCQAGSFMVLHASCMAVKATGALAVEATWSSQLKDNLLKSTVCSSKKTHVHASCSCKHHVLYANQQLEKALHANAKMGKGTFFSPLHDVFKILLPGKSHRNK